STLALDVSLQLDELRGGEGGVAATSGTAVYAYVPPADCAGKGSFRTVASTLIEPTRLALSNDGKWVATTDSHVLELLPRSDAAGGLSPAHLDFAAGESGVELAWSANQLTAIHPT